MRLAGSRALRLAQAAAWVGLSLPLVALAGPPTQDWLEVRRHGPEGVLAASAAVESAAPRWLRYRASVADGDPLAGATIDVLRQSAGPGRGVGPGKRQQVSVVVRDGKGALIAGLVSEGGRLWARHAASHKAPVDALLVVRAVDKGAADKAAAKAVARGAADKGAGVVAAVPVALAPLFVDVPTLGAPLALWAALELSERYEARLEGEFDGSAIVRLRPSYTRGAGLRPLKVGVSKQHLHVSLAEVDDGKGEVHARLLALDPKVEGGRVVAERLRLRLRGRTEPVDWVLVEQRAGKAALALVGRRALR